MFFGHFWECLGVEQMPKMRSRKVPAKLEIEKEKGRLTRNQAKSRCQGKAGV
jgi:hypothetical protein